MAALPDLTVADAGDAAVNPFDLGQATGTPEPGGLTSRELQMILHGLADLPIIGADIVEVAPAYDHAELTTIAAANMAYEFLALLAVHAAKNPGDTDDQR